MNCDSTPAETHQARKSGLRWQYYIAAALLTAGVLLSGTFFFEDRKHEFERVQKEFQQAGHNRILALKKILEIDFLAIKSVRSFYDGSSKVERQEFATFVTPLLENRPSIHSLQWAPRIIESQQAKFKSEAESDGILNFKIVETENGSLVGASPREEYYPIYFVEPYKSNADSLGFDLATIPEYRDAMQNSCDTGELASTRQMIMPEQRQQSGLRFFLPVYQRDASPKTVEDRRKYLQGFIVGILQISGIIEESFGALIPAGIDIYLFDGSTLSDNEILFYHQSRMYNQENKQADPETTIRQASMRLTEVIRVAGQKWRISLVPSPEFMAARTTWQPWVNGIGGLLLTGLLTIYLISITARGKKTAAIAAQLVKTNQKLKHENVDRVRAEEASGRENAKLSAMISGMEEGIIFADADNTIVEINNYLCNFLGKTRKEIIGHRIEEFHSGEHLGKILSQIEQFRKEVVPVPLVLQRPLGGKEVIFRMQPIYRGGKYDGVLLNIIDVSELVQARQTAEVANKTKSKFLANMSHEIRTPMAAILGYTDLLMDPKIDCSNRNNYLMVVRRNGENLLHLINDILDLSKIEAGKLILNIKRCSLVSLLADVASTMRPRAQLRGNNLTVEYLSELPETINTDGDRLRQALVNLVGNAVKFTENGQVSIQVSLLRQWQNDQPAVKIEVVDTGIGIREEILSHLFQPFNQGDVATTHKYGGTGLGLTISRHIAELLSGELTVKSVYGEGSAFALIVPTGDLEGVNILQQPSEIIEDLKSHCYLSDSKDLLGIRILVAEDSIDNQELIRTMLCKAGAKVEIVENGLIAVKKAESETFDIILMDMNMPEMDGYTATRLLRSRGYDRPILALTANAMADDKERCLAAGCNGYLSKPIDRMQMMRTIAFHTGKVIEESADISEVIEESSPIDDHAIISLYVNDPDIVPILDGYVERLGGQVDDMRAALADAQLVDLQRLAHRMKGSGANYGYPMLTEAAKALEDAAKAKDVQSAAQALQKIALLCKAVQNGYCKTIPAGANSS